MGSTSPPCSAKKEQWQSQVDPRNVIIDLSCYLSGIPAWASHVCSYAMQTIDTQKATSALSVSTLGWLRSNSGAKASSSKFGILRDRSGSVPLPAITTEGQMALSLYSQ